MAFLKTSDGVRIYYRFLNKSIKPPVVFVHGWAANWTCFNGMIRLFSRKKYPVLYLDLRGHGRSGKPLRLKDYSLERSAEDIRQILAYENQGKCYLVGHSMGGMVAALFAINYPEKTSGLVMIDSSYKSPLSTPRLKFLRTHQRFMRLLYNFALSHTSIRRKNTKELDMAKLKAKPDMLILINELAHTPLDVCIATAQAMFRLNITQKLSSIRAPTLIISSRDDEFFPVSFQRRFARRIPGASFAVVEGTHSVTIKNSRQASSLVLSFLLRHGL